MWFAAVQKLGRDIYNKVHQCCVVEVDFTLLQFLPAFRGPTCTYYPGPLELCPKTPNKVLLFSEHYIQFYEEIVPSFASITTGTQCVSDNSRCCSYSVTVAGCTAVIGNTAMLPRHLCQDSRFHQLQRLAVLSKFRKRKTAFDNCQLLQSA